jgi:steroid 5-alpha reductase family enzyme
MKHKVFIDTQKGATFIFVLLMMGLYDQWQNPTLWIYLALHGSYGFLWILKSRIFPDQAWERTVSWGFGLLSWAALCLYWVAPWLLAARGVQAPGWYLALCVSVYIFGVFAHFTTDMQKWATLKVQPDHLITDGMFARLRNTNYFGELLIYLGFGSLAMHWLPIAILLLWVVAYWLPRMRNKDRALSVYADFESYRKQTRLFLPYIF